MKVQFITPTTGVVSAAGGVIPGFSTPYINMVPFALKSFYKAVGKYYDRYEWVPTENAWYDVDETGFDSDIQPAINRIIQADPDIVCFSYYIWNSDAVKEIARTLRKNNPNIIMIIGGPQVDYQRGTSIFNELSDFDYAVYGDGEEAFQMLMDSFIEPIDERTIPNLITKGFKNKHKIFKFKNFPPYSPYLDLKEDYIQQYNLALELRNKNLIHLGFPIDLESVNTLNITADNSNHVTDNVSTFIEFPWEHIRGCPYACSFCDWSAGLHHKVTISQSNWKDELEFLSSFDFTLLYLTDANVGIIQEDVEIQKYVYKLVKKRQGRFKFLITNFAKMHKERTKEIEIIRSYGEEALNDESLRTVENDQNVFKNYYKLRSKSGGHSKISLQHIDEEVLKNIDRPSISWNEYKKYISDLRSYKKIITAELIQGLPGATYEKNMKQLSELMKAGVAMTISYVWNLLPNSPAYKKEYRDKFNIKTEDWVILNASRKIKNSNLIDNVKSKSYTAGVNKVLVAYDGTEDIKYYFKYVLYTRLYGRITPDLLLIEDDNLRLNAWNECVNLYDNLFEYISRLMSNNHISQLNEHGFFIYGLKIGDEYWDFEETTDKLHEIYFELVDQIAKKYLTESELLTIVTDNFYDRVHMRH